MKKLLLFLLITSKISSASNDVVLASNNEYVVVANENIARVYKIKTIEDKYDHTVYSIMQIDHGTIITALSITPDGKYIITGGGKYAKMWKIPGYFMAKLS